MLAGTSRRLADVSVSTSDTDPSDTDPSDTDPSDTDPSFANTSGGVGDVVGVVFGGVVGGVGVVGGGGIGVTVGGKRGSGGRGKMAAASECPKDLGVRSQTAADGGGGLHGDRNQASGLGKLF
jgi:hypothetical protein